MSQPNSAPHTSLQEWLRSPLGQRVYGLERRLVSEALAQVFGWQLLQIGLWGDDDGLLTDARTQRKAVLANKLDHSVTTQGFGRDARADDKAGGQVEARARSADIGGHRPSIYTRPEALAIASDAVDAVLLPHTLEYEANPHEILREVARILPGEGQLVILGFRPFSGWGLRHSFAGRGFPPGLERLIGEWRLRDWLKLLGFEVTDSRRYLFTWPWGTAAPRGQRFLESVGERAWPLLAGAYLLKARKRVYAITPIRPRWRTAKPVVGGLLEPTARNVVERGRDD